MGSLLWRAALLAAGLLACGGLLAQGASGGGLPVLEIGALEHVELRDPVQFLAADATTPQALERLGLLDDFRPLRDADINQGVSDQPFWLRVRLRNDRPEPVEWILHGETTYLDHMHVFLQDGANEEVFALSDREPFGARPLDYRKLGLRHATAAHSYTDLYLRAAYEPGRADALSLNFELWTPEGFQRARAVENLFFGASYGSQLTLMAIAFIVFLLMQRRAYALYGLFLASSILLWLALNGFGFQHLWPDSPWWHNEGFHLIFLFYSVCALLFSREFLATAEHFPRVDKLLLALVAFGAGAALLRLTGVYVPVLYAAAFLIGSLAFLPLLGALAWRRGVSHAFWFMLAWLVHGCGLLLGLLSGYTDLLHWGMEPLLLTQAGASLENLLLLFATAQRVVFLDRERRQALALANTDPLTGLGNRRMLSRHYEVLRDRFRRTGEPVYLILIDVDHFKRINDEYGHEAGDQVLVELADLLNEASRSSDACVRYGGEEFAILLQAEDFDAALGMAERIRRRFERGVTRYDGREIRHTLSIGLTTVFDAGRELDEREMINQADEALYRSKAGGRNLTIAFG